LVPGGTLTLVTDNLPYAKSLAVGACPMVPIFCTLFQFSHQSLGPSVSPFCLQALQRVTGWPLQRVTI
jgi:hypothetical protein